MFHLTHTLYTASQPSACPMHLMFIFLRWHVWSTMETVQRSSLHLCTPPNPNWRLDTSLQRYAVCRLTKLISWLIGASLTKSHTTRCVCCYVCLWPYTTVAIYQKFKLNKWIHTFQICTHAKKLERSVGVKEAWSEDDSSVRMQCNCGPWQTRAELLTDGTVSSNYAQ